ncbi:hypothetical protein AMATHDRAFT_2957 [Amanita thiersii Skay4041]|uniref:ubiquitinyl hydrolase 1 n=1 Tax=Amanita thiersii Skay4041 TaxID=703135 RepID=A0A2A9NUX2_9AGAR|nr:hypothetical protein AMATHDRAFT_2957 [Amanita thiersii Skay4041]
MSSLQDLSSFIYHERQQQGSALCAQHALNNLLQGNYFSAPELSVIAQNLDMLELSYRGISEPGGSTNMDDTGFFSVQVIENALKVWGLSLVRWRGEEMRLYHDRPHCQLAFILNLEQHWFTLRRFGHAEPDIHNDTGDGHWFNLNSFLPSPDNVYNVKPFPSGYSVFAITQADSSGPLALPRTEADAIASTISEPDDPAITMEAPSRSNTRDSTEGVDDFEEEDFELQAALQASLAGDRAHSQSSSHVSTEEARSPSNLASGDIISLSHSTPQSNSRGHADVDPITASMERNRVMLQRLREQQEFAQRELWSEGLTPEQIEAQEVRREARRRQEEEEEEQLRQAIAESEAMARKRSQKGDTRQEASQHGSPMDVVYDDDDAEFQAALRASLEDTHNDQQQTTGLDITTPDINHSQVTQNGTHSMHNPDDTDVHDLSSSPEVLSLDEMRRKRLARFGG